MTSFEDLCKKVTIQSHSISEPPPWKCETTYGKPVGFHGYSCVLRFKEEWGARESCPIKFWMGEAHTNPPTSADVLGCMLRDISGIDGNSFEEWAEEYGYDSDSKKAESIYNKIAEQKEDIEYLLGESYQDFYEASGEW